MTCFNRPFHFKFHFTSKDCISQASLGPFLNTLSNMLSEYMIRCDKIHFVITQIQSTIDPLKGLLYQILLLPFRNHIPSILRNLYIFMRLYFVAICESKIQFDKSTFSNFLKSFHIRNFSGSYFPAFGLNMKIYFYTH